MPIKVSACKKGNMKKNLLKSICLLFLFYFLFSLNGKLWAKDVPYSANYFIENNGQHPEQQSIRYYFQTGQYSFYIKDNGVSYVTEAQSEDSLFQHRVDIDFMGATNKFQIQARGKLPSHSNYYLNGKSFQGHHYSEVMIQNLYPGIDLLYRLDNKGNLKYEFEVAPGADPNVIKMKFTGQTGMSLRAGTLNIETINGALSELKPYSFTMEGEEIESAFKLNENILSYQLGAHPSNQKFTIDPTVLWSGYHGGSSNDFVQSTGLDSSKNIYLTGSTLSRDYPNSVGAHQSSLSGRSDVFISKLDSASNFKWATYFGGLDDEFGNDLAIDQDHNVYIAAETESNSLSITLGAFQSTLSGGADAFIAKFDSSGQLEWSTYFGGRSDDFGKTIDVDALGYAYLGGYTQSSNLSFAVTNGAFQSTIGGGADGFISKFGPMGKLVWSTYLGGSQAEEIMDLKLDDSSNVYITGRSASTNFPVSPNALQSQLGGSNDMIIAKFDSTGSRRWATYLGHSDDEIGYSITIDENYHVYVTGTTRSDSLTVYGNSFQDTFGGGNSDAIIASMYANGLPKWSTFLGGSDIDEAHSIDYERGLLVTVGFTASNSFPIKGNTFQNNRKGQLDGFFVNLDTAGNVLLSSFIGGSSNDRLTHVKFYFGAQLLTGFSQSVDYYSLNSSQPKNAGANDAVLTLLCPELQTTLINPNGILCVRSIPDSITAFDFSTNYNVSYQWQVNSGNKWKNIPGAIDANYYPGNVQSRTSYRRIVQLGVCDDTSDVATIVFADQPTAEFGISPERCSNDSLNFTNKSSLASGTYTSLWQFGDGDSSSQYSPSHSYKSERDYRIILEVESDSGCVDRDTAQIFINQSPKAEFGYVTSCKRDSTLFVDSTISDNSYSISWDLGDGQQGYQKKFSYLYQNTGTYTVSMKATTDSLCADSLSTDVIIDSALIASFQASNRCTGDSVEFINTSDLSSGKISFQWDFGDGDSSTAINPSHYYSSASENLVTLKVENDKNCSDSFQNTIRITERPAPNLEITSFCDTNEVHFKANLLKRDSLYEYSWNLGDGNQIEDTTEFSYGYSSFGSFAISFIVTVDSAACVVRRDTLLYNDSLIKADFEVRNLCEGYNSQFTNTSELSSGNITYLWDFDDGQKSNAQNPTHQYTAGIYTVSLMVASDSGCSDTSSQSIIIGESPKASFSFDTACFGQAVRFFNQSNNNGLGFSGFYWYFGDGDNSSTLENPNHKYSNEGTIEVLLVAEGVNGCLDTAQRTILQSGPLQSSIINRTNPTCFGDSDGSMEVSAEGGIEPIELYWDTDPIEYGNQIIELPAGTYSVILSDSIECTDTFSFELEAPDSLIVSLPESVSICEGDTGHLPAQATGGTFPYDYQWSCNQPSCAIDSNMNDRIIVRPKQEIIYMVELIDSNGCRSKPDSVTLSLLPNLSIDAGADREVIAKREFKLKATTVDKGTPTWEPAEYVNSPNNLTTTAILSEDQLFTVRLEADSSCPGIDSVFISTSDGINFASAFSPNDDMVNDKWVIENIEYFPECKVQVYNRWGKAIYTSTKGYENPWDGTYEGKELPGGAYFYLIDLKNGSDPLTGSVTILK